MIGEHCPGPVGCMSVYDRNNFLLQSCRDGVGFGSSTLLFISKVSAEAPGCHLEPASPPNDGFANGLQLYEHVNGGLPKLEIVLFLPLTFL
jgi:hypothetical protein